MKNNTTNKEKLFVFLLVASVIGVVLANIIVNFF